MTTRSSLSYRPLACIVGAVVALASCDPLIHERPTRNPRGPAVAIVDPEYVVLRPVAAEPLAVGQSAVIYGRTVYFRSQVRILDLRHLDPRTAAVDRAHDREGVYVIWIETTAKGSELLRNWTSRNVGKQLGIFIDGRLVSAPVVKSTIIDTVLLDADFTRQEAEEALERLRRGGSRK